MPSQALQHWRGTAQDVLAEVVNAHKAVGGTGPGRRWLTQEINYAYVTRLTAQFQGFCRELHSEAARAVSLGVPSLSLRIVVSQRLTEGRTLDKGNPNAANLGSDFNRFGFNFWEAVRHDHAHSAGRRAKLDGLIEWRNGIVHDDLERRRLAGQLNPPRLKLSVCRSWHGALDNLAASFDSVMTEQCENLTGNRPW